MANTPNVGERVRILRLASNLSQTELAKALFNGTSEGNSLVSRIENGRYPVDSSTLRTLAEILGCDPEFLEADPSVGVATRPWLRAYADAPARTVDSVVADNTLAAEAITRLELRRIPDRIPMFVGDLNDDHAIEEFAQEVRSAAEIPEGAVVGNAMRAAERLGCVILPLSSELGRHLGLSQRIDGVPHIRVSRPGRDGNGVPGDRQRFTVLHELGHLALHAELPPPESADEARRIERQAHRFASAFLAPAEQLLEDWEELGGRVTLSVLAELKATWGVAIKALVVRFQQLGVIGSDQATSLYKQISKRGWNKAEPVDTTNEEPVWLSLALTRRFEVGAGTSVTSLAARRTLLSERYIRSWVDWSPVSSPAPVSDFPTRARPDGAHIEEGLGRVLSFPQAGNGARRSAR